MCCSGKGNVKSYFPSIPCPFKVIFFRNPDDIRSQREELMRRASEIDAEVSHIMEKIQTAQKDP